MSLALALGLSLGSTMPAIELTTFTARAMGNEFTDTAIGGIAPNGSGWVVEVTLPDITDTTGTIDPSKFVINVSDPGFDTDGSATTWTRQFGSQAPIRRMHPNADDLCISTDGTDLTILLAVEDWIYSGSTIVSCMIEPGFYPSFGGGLADVTNNSALAYPKPVFAWSSFPGESVTSNSFYVEGMAAHRHGMSGQMVAYMAFTATDGTNTTPAVGSGTSVLSTLTTSGNRPEAFGATLDISTLTQGAAATVDAVVYPWIGTAYTLSSEGISWPTVYAQTPLRFHVDRTGAYGGAYAYVQVGASGGTVSDTPATAAADPYPTITSAAIALRAWNNTNRSHNDLGGATIRLMDDAGADETHSLAGNLNVYGNGDAVFTIEKDPGATGVVTLFPDQSRNYPTENVRIRNLRVQDGGTGGTSGGLNGTGSGTGQAVVENCELVSPGTSSVGHIRNYKKIFYRNCTFSGAGTVNFSTNIGDGGIDMHGCVFPPTMKTNRLNNVFVWVGCDTPYDDVTVLNSLFAFRSIGSGSGVFDEGRFVYNNKMPPWNQQNDHATNGYDTYSIGAAFVQNEFVRKDGNATTSAFRAFSDGDTCTITNFIEYYTTGIGERCSRLYNDALDTKVVPYGVLKQGNAKFCIWDNTNTKHDTFAGTLNNYPGSVGAWAWMYNVGNTGNVSLFGVAGRGLTDVPHNDSTDPAYLGAAWLDSSEYNLQRAGLGFGQAGVLAMFTDYRADPASIDTTRGDHHLAASSTPLRSRVPAGLQALRYDLDGVLRKTDGTGAAGCFEYVAA